MFCCGHCLCCDCVWILQRQVSGLVSRSSRGINIKCPLCRTPTLTQEISFVTTSRKHLDQEEIDISVKVNFSNFALIVDESRELD